MKVLVVDDHPLMAEALALALQSLQGGAIVETAQELDGAMRLAGAAPAPDMVLLDLGLPGCSGLEALHRFRERFPALPVVVVSASSEIPAILSALDLGAMGYIPKNSPREVMVNAVRLIAAGGIYIPSEAVASRPSASHASFSAARTSRLTAKDLGLSPRQADVLALLLKGLPNKLIARTLDISENTVKAHVSAVLRALGVTSRTHALIAASRLGLRLDS